MAGQGEAGTGSAGVGTPAAGRQGDHVSTGAGSRASKRLSVPTPLFAARNSDRYERQEIIAEYEDYTGARLIVMIDQIFEEGVTYLDELLYDLDGSAPLHMILASPGGDGETAVRMVRSLHARCTELTVIVPDMAKSAATLICLGADHIVMGPAGDLGPIDPQFLLNKQSLAGAKDIVRAVDEAEERLKRAPDTYPLFAALLADVNMLMVQQARSAMAPTPTPRSYRRTARKNSGYPSPTYSRSRWSGT
ncbi:SDH family Clp fold serine proteinase [Planosporangium flavigriseum]|uniref:Serine dehydrogenase proteinase n=1 Tax=Planosporangium flavigriseum TaxID=373681 RepID=A0A8J3LMF0_9ACTN|nr:hypothetical protein Pfl04_15870 [Planosporangium flavigriseum]